MKIILFISLFFNCVLALTAQQPAYFGTIEKTEYPVTPENAVSLCMQTSPFLDEEIILQLPFSFPFFSLELNEIILGIDVTGYVLTEELSDDDDWNLFLFGGIFGNWGDLFNLCISDVVTYADTISDISCFTVEYKDVSHFYDMPFPPTGIIDHRFNFLHKFCEDGSIHFTFGECEVHEGISFEEGYGFWVPFDEEKGIYGPWIWLRKFENDDEQTTRDYAFVMEQDSVVLITEFEPEKIDVFSFLLEPGTTFTFRPVIETAITDKNEIKQQFKIYPNPSNGVLYIRSNTYQNNSVITYRIHDVNGRMQMDGKLTSDQQEVNTMNLSPGVYFIYLYDENGVLVQIDKIIRN